MILVRSFVLIPFALSLNNLVYNMNIIILYKIIDTPVDSCLVNINLCNKLH